MAVVVMCTVSAGLVSCGDKEEVTEKNSLSKTDSAENKENENESDSILSTLKDLQIVESGTCGENLTWEFDSEGTLNINGTGEMEDYGYRIVHTPWYDYVNDIKKVVLEDGVTTIGTEAFNNCVNLSEVKISDSVKIIKSAFIGCTSLKEINIPDNVTSIGTFKGCTSLTSIKLSENLENIGEFTFEGCTSLKAIIISDSITNIDNWAFADTGLTEITIPNSVDSIGESAFGNCENLMKITILNPDCKIEDFGSTITNGYIIDDNDYRNRQSFFNGTIYGYENSTAQEYAEKYGYNFEAIE